MCRDLSKFSVRLSVVCRLPVRVRISFEPQIIRKHSSTGQFALKNTSVWDISSKALEYGTVQMSRLLKFRDIPTQSVQGPPLPCGCNLVNRIIIIKQSERSRNYPENFRLRRKNINGIRTKSSISWVFCACRRNILGLFERDQSRECFCAAGEKIR